MYEGKIILALNGCGYSILTTDETFVPVNLPSEFEVVDTEVLVQFELTGETINCAAFIGLSKKINILHIEPL